MRMMCSRTKVDLDPRNDVYVLARASPAGHAQAIHSGKKEAKFVQLNEYETDLYFSSIKPKHGN